jgi:hypothetical protein
MGVHILPRNHLALSAGVESGIGIEMVPKIRFDRNRHLVAR